MLGWCYASAGCPATRTERLVNLVICLLSTRRFLTAAQIAATVPGLRARPGRSARPRGVPAQVRARQGRAAGSGRTAGDRHRQRLRHRARLPDRPAASTPCPTSRWSRTRPRRWASPPGCGSTPGWPRPLPPGWPSCAPPGSTSIRTSTLGRGAGGDRGPGVRAADRGRPGAPGGALRLPRTGGRTRRPPAGCSRGAWSAGAAAGTWSATTWTGTRRGVSGCPGWSARCAARPSPARSAAAGVGPDQLCGPLVGRRWSGPGRATVLVRPGRAAGVRRLGRAGRRRARTATWRCCVTPIRSRWPAWLVGYGADVVVLDPPEVREAVDRPAAGDRRPARAARVSAAGGGRTEPLDGRAASSDPRAVTAAAATGWAGC